jgi:microcystin degradation protein MlrC
MRIALAGITNEALAWSPLPTRLEDFRVLRGADVLQTPGLGWLADQPSLEVVPILSATHIAPGGIVERSAYVQLRREIVDGLQAVGGLVAGV